MLGLGFSVVSLDNPADPETHAMIDLRYAVINAAITPYSLAKHLSIPVIIDKAERPSHALLDSGAMGNFINENLVMKLNLTRTPRVPLPLMDVKGIKIGELRFQVTVTLCINQHDEKITLDVAPIGAHNLILGLPWLQMHNPTVNWHTGHIQFNSHYCSTYCFPCPHDVFAKQEPIALNTLEPDLVEIYAIDLMPTATEEALWTFVPPEYHDYLDVFDPEGPM